MLINHVKTLLLIWLTTVTDTPTPVDWDGLLTDIADHREGWVTVDEASAAAGVSRSTLRSWYRSGAVPSRLVDGTHGPQRLVPLDPVLDRAVRSARLQSRLRNARSVDAELADLRRRVEILEQRLNALA
jgi:transposase